MIHEGHAVHVCIHGLVTQQCKCPAPDKAIRLDHCPPECARADVRADEPECESACVDCNRCRCRCDA